MRWNARLRTAVTYRWMVKCATGACALRSMECRTDFANMTMRFSGEEVAAIDAARARADSVLGLWGDRASPPLDMESSREYRRRVLAAVQDRSPKHKGKTYSTLGDALGIVEEQVYADAATAAEDPSTVPVGQMRVIRERDAAGRLITRWIGSDYMGALWDHFAMPGALGTINRNVAGKAR